MVKPRTRIFVALFIGTFFIGSAVFVRLSEPEANQSPENIAVVENKEVRPFIPTNDNNADDVPDWMEALLGELITLPATDTEPYNPTTTTGKIAVEIFSSIAATENVGRSLNVQEFISNQVQDSRELMVDPSLTRSDIRVISDNSTASLKRYGNTVANAILTIEADEVEEEELVLLARALQTESQKPIEDLAATADAYDRLLTSIMNEPVPSSLEREHLALLNVITALRNNTRSFANVFDDPVLSIIRLERHTLDSKALYTAIINLYQKLYDAGIQWSSDDVVLDLIEIQP